MKPTIVFFNADMADQDYFPEAFSDEFSVSTHGAALTAETVALASGAEVVSVRAASHLPAEILAKLPHLRHIACRTTGYDNIDLVYAAAHNITVSNIPRYGESTVAEYAFLLLMAITRRLLPTVQATQMGPVVQTQLMGHDLAGKTLGVIGTGRIGQHAAGIGRGFGMAVLGYDIYPQPAAAEKLGFTYVELEELLRRSDYVTLHAPATPQTHHLLDAAAFAKLKPGAFIVNTARGTLIDTTALIEALEDGRVAGAALDVLEGEEYVDVKAELHLLGTKRLGEKGNQVLGLSILSKLPNVIITAHNGYNTAEALERIRQTAADNIRHWHTDNPVNLVTNHK